MDILHEEWKSVWMLQKTRKRKSIEEFQFQTLQDVVMVGDDDVVMRFGTKFRELKVEGSHKK